MAGGLLNLVSGGSQNAIMYGNPQKTYWTSTYKQITNFGIQNFRLDFEGQRKIQMTTDSTFTFKIKRYAELLTTTYLVMDLPDIYSPIYETIVEEDVDTQFTTYVCTSCGLTEGETCTDTSGCCCCTFDISNNIITELNQPVLKYRPYEFKWIKNIGAMMIRSIKFMIGGNLIQQLSGHDIVALANRDLNGTTKLKWDELIGNIPELYDPASVHENRYPNAINYTYNGITGSEPSIRGRQLRVPLPIWWGLTSQQAFPLVCLQYNELTIEVVLRPMSELYQICNVTADTSNGELETDVISPNMNIAEHQFNNFINPPQVLPVVDLPNQTITWPEISSNTTWYENIHLSCNYCFLSDDEAASFASRSQQYLIREIRDTWFNEVNIADKVWLQNSSGLVTSWMFLFQRSDVKNRNEWSNFTNWPFNKIPKDIVQFYGVNQDEEGSEIVGPTFEHIFITGEPHIENQKHILNTLGILIDGAIREEIKPYIVYSGEQQYLTNQGLGNVSLPGLYSYHFCLKTDPFTIQPSGAMNLSKYGKIEIDFTTITPPVDPDATYTVLCDPITGIPIETSKSVMKLYLYYYNLLVIEERYNILTFVGGNAGMMNAR